MFAQKLAPWTDLTAGFRGHPLSYDEAFERSKASVLRFKWNYAVIVCVCTLLVLLPHPFLLVATAVIIYVAGVLYADLPPSALRDAVPQAQRPFVVGGCVCIAVLFTDVVGNLIVGIAVGAAMCAAHAVYVEPPVSFEL